MAMPQRDNTIEAIKRRAVEKKAAVSVKDLLKAHALMTKGLVERPGEFRKCAVDTEGQG